MFIHKHPYPPFIPKNATKLIVGTLPPPRFYTGILKVTENQDQLAAIIAHEVGHVIENHSNERISSQRLSQTSMAIAGAALESHGIKNRNLYMSGLGIGLQYGVLMPDNFF